MKIFKLEKFGRFLKTVGKQVVVGLTSISLIGLPACGTSFDAPKPVQKQKDYNYYFKVIVPEEMMRSMTNSEHEQMVTKIEKMGGILDKSIDKTRRNLESDVITVPASVAAAVFVSSELRATVDELSEDGVEIMFPFHELLLDHADHLEGRNVTGESKVMAKIFVYDRESSPRDSNAWDTEEFFIQTVTTEKLSVADKETLQEMTFAKNPEVANDFFESLVENVAADPSVTLDRGEQSSMEKSDATTDVATSVILSTSSSEMTVELNGSVDNLMAVNASNGDMTGEWSKNLRGKIKSVSADVQSTEDENAGMLQKRRWRCCRKLFKFVGTAVAVVVVSLVVTTVVVAIVAASLDAGTPDAISTHK
jgi:hypothetical protein